MVLIGGCTGNGKTLLVKQHAQVSIWKGWRTIAARRLAARSRRSFRRPALKTTWRLSC
jgi:hypothetical protein